MSMRSWTEDGFGFKLYDDFDKVKKFVIENGKYDDEAKAEMYKCEDEYDLAEYTDDPIPWVVAGIINDKEGQYMVKGYQSNGDTNQEAMLGIEPVYPWAPQKFKDRDEATAFLKKYAEVLGINEEPDYFEAEYYG